MWKGKSGQRAKIIAPVAFPLENLSLEPFLEPEAEEKDDDDVVVVEKPARGKGKSPVKKGSNKRKSSVAANEDKQQKEKDETTNAGSSKSSTYDLYACVAPHGQAANAGHYTAVARDLAGDNRWRQPIQFRWKRTSRLTIFSQFRSFRLEICMQFFQLL